MVGCLYIRSHFLPTATKLGQGNVFTGVCDSVNRGGVPGLVTGGCTWSGHGRGVCTWSGHGRGVCTWSGHGSGVCTWSGPWGVYLADPPPRTRYTLPDQVHPHGTRYTPPPRIRPTSSQYASYWNAFLLQ